MKKVSPVAVVVGGLVVLFMANYAVVQLGFKPYLYCSFREMAWEMYAPFQVLISLVGILGLIIFGLRGRWGYATLSALVTASAYIGPEWARILFSVGKGCA